MSYIGKKYECITDSIPYLYKNEIVEVIEFDIVNDFVKIRRERDNTDLFVGVDKFYNGFIYYDNAHLLYSSFYGNTQESKKCDCGVSKTYGKNAQGFMHYTDCPAYINDKYKNDANT